MNDLPTANARRRKSRWWLHPSMLFPLLAIALVAWLLQTYYHERGIPIQITFHEGYGLKAGDALRYRGIDVGVVQQVELAPDLGTIYVNARLIPSARDVARQGSKFWIVRPELGLSGASGLETLVGANYIRVLPGQGGVEKHFTGLETPPLLDLLEPGGVEILLTTSGQSGLRRGAALSYRQVIIGTVLNIDLAKDASSVEARVYINPKYTHLIREQAKFWKVGGAKFSAGLTGLSWQIDSLQSLISGGVMMAVPPSPGQPVTAGQRFPLHDEPQQAWLEWTPYLSPLPHQASERPQLLPVSLRWDNSGWFKHLHAKRRDGWVLPLRHGLLAPLNLFVAPDYAKADSVQLRLGADSLKLETEATPYAPGIGLLPYRHAYPTWSLDDIRLPDKPEDVLIGTDFRTRSRFVEADKFQVINNGTWHITPSLKFDASWHGAAVVASSDSDLLGIVLINEDNARVALLMAEME
jgi:hypothetical protein